MTRRALPPAAALIAFAHGLADRSGAVIRPFFRKPIDVHDKRGAGVFDPVTVADRAAEQVIVAEIRRAWPTHAIVGEEHGGHDGSADLTWVIDPIDGTRAFIMGLPVWGTLIGLLHRDVPHLGLMDQPFTGERFWSGPRAAYTRGSDGTQRRIRTRSCPRLADAIVSTTHPDLFSAGEELDAFLRVKAEARMTRYGGDCYAYCLLAMGFIDAIVEAGLQPYDVVALIPIVERAGGRMTTWDGRPAREGGRIVASGDPHLHDAILRRLAG